MKTIVLLCLLLIPAHLNAKPHTCLDNAATMRILYLNTWKPTILSMFADAGTTRIYLDGNTLTIVNANCADRDVKSALDETFGSPVVKRKMLEIDMKLRCDNDALARR